VLSVVSL